MWAARLRLGVPWRAKEEGEVEERQVPTVGGTRRVQLTYWLPGRQAVGGCLPEFKRQE